MQILIAATVWCTILTTHQSDATCDLEGFKSDVHAACEAIIDRIIQKREAEDNHISKRSIRMPEYRYRADTSELNRSDYCYINTERVLQKYIHI